jgi:hypothetical protein
MEAASDRKPISSGPLSSIATIRTIADAGDGNSDRDARSLTKKKREVHSNNPARTNPGFAESLFSAARQPASWLSVGRNLRSQADIIFRQEGPVATKWWNEFQRICKTPAETGAQPEEFDYAKFPPPNLDVGYMLVAFAIENFLKGLIVPTLNHNAVWRKLPKELTTHDLICLQRRAAPSASIAAYLLDYLTYLVEWRGRYPTPVYPDGFWRVAPEGIPRSAGPNWPADHHEIVNYCDSLATELQAAVGNSTSATS